MGWSICSTKRTLVHIPNQKRAGPYPQLERGPSISPTRKGVANIANRKEARPQYQLEKGTSISKLQRSRSMPPTKKGTNRKRGHSISSTGKGPVHIPNRKGAGPYPQLEEGRTISPTKKRLANSPNFKEAGPTRKGVVHSYKKILGKKRPVHIPN